MRKIRALVSLIICFTIICAIFQRCAIPRLPDGGPLDKTPPKILNSVPANGTLNFKDKKIQIFFDEYIELNEPNKEILITPPLLKPALYTLKKRSLIIDFGENVLNENTTYSISLGNSIKDLHAGNKLGGYNFVFSTGSYLDSFSIEGKVIDALTQKEVDGARILLYKKDNDSLIYKHKPDYYTIADKAGNFHVEHLKNDTFTMYALMDKNDNLVYDQGEDIAIFPTRVIPTYTAKPDTSVKSKPDSNVVKRETYVLRTFNPVREKSILKSYAFSLPRFTLKFGKVPTYISIVALRPEIAGVKASSIPVMWNAVKAKDSIQCWIPAYGDTPAVNQGFRKYTENTWLPVRGDTANIRLIINIDSTQIDTILTTKPVQPKDAFKMRPKIENSSAIVNKYNTPLLLTSTMPIKKVMKEGIKILPGSSVKSSFHNWSYADSSHTLLLMDATLDPDTSTRIRVEPGTFVSIYNTTNDTMKLAVQPLQSRNFGHMNTSVVLPANTSSYIFQIVDKDYRVYYEKILSASTVIDLPLMDPGTYHMRVIEDANHNGRWDNGSLARKQIPEKVYYYPSELVIKANWDLLDLKFDVKE